MIIDAIQIKPNQKHHMALNYGATAVLEAKPLHECTISEILLFITKTNTDLNAAKTIFDFKVARDPHLNSIPPMIEPIPESDINTPNQPQEPLPEEPIQKPITKSKKEKTTNI